MAPAATPNTDSASDFAVGDDRPDPVFRLMAFGFYDGATDGVLETAAGRSYWFDIIDEWPTRGDADSVRMFLLSPLPPGSFARLVELIAPHCQPRFPFWVPSWWHLPADQKAALDRDVDAILDSAGPPAWAVAGHFLCGLRLRVRRGVPGRDADGWAAFGFEPRPA